MARVSSVIASVDRRLARLRMYRSDSRPLVKLQSLLAAVAIITVILLILDGSVATWREGSGSGSEGVDVLWWVVRVLYSLAKLTLVAVLIATIRQWFVSRRKSSSSMKMPASRGIRWRQVPWSLWAYVILTTGGIFVAVATASGPVAPSLFFVAFILAWNYLLLRGLRWLWIGTTVLSACFFGIDLVTGTGTWHGDVLGLIELGLLLAPPTRRFFSGTNPRLAMESAS